MCKKTKYAVTAIGLLGLSAWAGFEYIYRTRDRKSIAPDKDTKIKWTLVSENDMEKVYKANISFKNHNEHYEGTMARMRVKHHVLFKNEYCEGLGIEAKISTKNEALWKDGYIESFLMPKQSVTEAELEVKFFGNLDLLKQVHAVVFEIKYDTYQRVGYNKREKDIIFVPQEEEIKQSFTSMEEQGASIYPVKTHLLTESDDIGEVIKKYTDGFLKDGDIVVIAESPVAITESRINQPINMELSWLTKRLCYFVPSAGSLASPYGMQSAIDQIGALKFTFAMLGGAFMKLLGKNGWFYTLAGLQSELIDDLTGTIPPFDKYIVLGPKDPDKTVREVKAMLDVNADIAIADANDLKRARILASTCKDPDAVKKWLLNNPAGNSNQQTPIVIIRPIRAGEN